MMGSGATWQEDEEEPVSTEIIGMAFALLWAICTLSLSFLRRL
jgi:hypothetical protein